MNWRIIVAVGATFVVGAAVGGFAEHQRVENDKPEKTANGTNTTGAGAPAGPANWFGSKKTAACPGLKKWSTAASAAYTSALGSESWSAKQTTIEKQTAAMGSAFRDLRKLANPAGKAELAVLTTYVGKLNAEAKKAETAAAYTKAQKTLAGPRITRDLAIVGQAANTCPKTT